MLYYQVFTYTFLFVLGSVMGSFCMLVGQRMAEKQSIVKPRSHCSNCQHQLLFWELIPILSFFIVKRKCTSCGTKLTSAYVFLELLSGIVFSITPWLLYWHQETIVVLTMYCLLIIISVSDITKRIIPNKVLLFFLIVLVIERLFIPTYPWWSSALGGFLGFSILFILAWLSKGGMGGGDIKLFGVLGIVLGWQGTLIALIVASLLGLVFGIIQIVRGVAKDRYIPFGPFLALGTYVTHFVLTGQYIHVVRLFNPL